jgi:hypothetical protein
MRDKRTWIIYEINHDGERCDLVPWFWPSEVGSQDSRTQFRCFRLAFHSLSFLLCFSRQPYNAREFSNLWLWIGAPTRSAPCAAEQAARPWSRPWTRSSKIEQDISRSTEVYSGCSWCWTVIFEGSSLKVLRKGISIFHLPISIKQFSLIDASEVS